MNKISCVISCPIDTYSGYGARSRDFVKAVIESQPDWDVKILSQRWGETRWGYLNDHQEVELLTRVVPQLTQQPDVWMQISVPNEFQKVGKYNIGVTAGIETTLCDPSWITGANNMDLLLVSSNHAADTFKRSVFDIENNKTGTTQKVELHTKMEVLFEGADLTKYFSDKHQQGAPITQTLDKIPESFCYLTTGHWMQGAFGEDRKNVGFTIKTFLETFKNKKNAPALIMKSNCVTTSIMDRERMLDKIEDIRKTVKGKLPNVYLIHGEISDSEMNALYNHDKVKALVSFTKGEGFGRPLLEFSLTNKPIIVSGWSGQLDFLDTKFVRLVKGELKNVHDSAVIRNMILKESQWFTPDPVDTASAYKDIFKNYKEWLKNAKRQGHNSRTHFSYEKMAETLKDLLGTSVPEFPKQIELTLPKLQLPKLKKL